MANSETALPLFIRKSQRESSSVSNTTSVPRRRFCARSLSFQAGLSAEPRTTAPAACIRTRAAPNRLRADATNFSSSVARKISTDSGPPCAATYASIIAKKSDCTAGRDTCASVPRMCTPSTLRCGAACVIRCHSVSALACTSARTRTKRLTCSARRRRSGRACAAVMG
eukprot:scaffold23491_cov66-Phaeocystis_antarctica.AAC.1